MPMHENGGPHVVIGTSGQDHRSTKMDATWSTVVDSEL